MSTSNEENEENCFYDEHSDSQLWPKDRSLEENFRIEMVPDDEPSLGSFLEKGGCYGEGSESCDASLAPSKVPKPVVAVGASYGDSASNLNMSCITIDSFDPEEAPDDGSELELLDEEAEEEEKRKRRKWLGAVFLVGLGPAIGIALGKWFGRNDDDDDLAAGVENIRDMTDTGYQGAESANQAVLAGPDQMQAFAHESMRSINTAQSAASANSAAGGAATNAAQ